MRIFEKRGEQTLLYVMTGDWYERDFSESTLHKDQAYAAFGVQNSVGDTTESRVYIRREFQRARLHAYCATPAAYASPYVTIVREDQLQDELDDAKILRAYGVNHKVYVGREHTDEVIDYFERHASPADRRASEGRAAHLAAASVSAASASSGVYFWRAQGQVTARSALVSLAAVVDGFLAAPRDAALLDFRGATMQMTAAEFAGALETVELGLGAIEAPVAVIVDPGDVPLMADAVRRASMAGRLFGVFTGDRAHHRSVDWLKNMARAMPRRPAAAPWRAYVDQVLGKIRKDAAG